MPSMRQADAEQADRATTDLVFTGVPEGRV